MDVRLDGRVAAVTGGSKGLGLATATRYAESGARVAILARDEAQLDVARKQIAADTGREVMAVSCDVARPEDVTRAFGRIASELGPVDILLNGAGNSERGRFEDLTDERLRADLEIKLLGNIRCIREVWPSMKDRRWGRVLNIVNTGAKAPTAGGAPTQVTRASQIAMTKVLAHEGAPFNVLVNALCVGRIRSDQFVRAHRNSGTQMTYEEYTAARGKDIPMGRMGDAEEFASLACFLASESASYITGAAINIDGGLSPVV